MESNSTAFLIKIKLRHSLGRPSRSDFVQSVFKEILYEENRMYNAMYYAFICFECLWWRCQ